MRDFDGDRALRRKYHESRLATEVALLKFNTKFEKRDHSVESSCEGDVTRSTHYESKYMQANAQHFYGVRHRQPSRVSATHERSPLQDRAYREHSRSDGRFGGYRQQESRLDASFGRPSSSVMYHEN